LEPLRAGDLAAEAVHWWELAGHDPVDLANAWAQAHHAVRIAGLVGKSWASPRGDGQHAALTWYSGQGLLDGLFASEPVAGDRPMRGVIRLWNLDLLFVEESGAPIDEMEVSGKTLQSVRNWMINAVSQQAGKAGRTVPENQPKPEHGVASGDEFGELSQMAHAELMRLYGNTASVLEQVSWTVDGASPVRVWPHSFEMSTQVRLSSADEMPPKLVVMGLAPPGKLSAGGYWYVAPWRTNVKRESDSWDKLPFGSWHLSEGELPIAVLPIEEVVESEDPAVQHDRVAKFFAASFNICQTNMVTG
jgi:hypothetical protein